jgi:hypothetical protein
MASRTRTRDRSCTLACSSSSRCAASWFSADSYTERSSAHGCALLIRRPPSANVSIRQHTAAYGSIRQHTSAYVSIRQHTSAYVSIRHHMSAYVSMCQHVSAYGSIRQQTSVYVIYIYISISIYLSVYLCPREIEELMQ